MIEYRVWNEVSDLLGEHDNATDAEAQVKAERAACKCGEAGELACGVLNPHGIHVQVCEDGYDITHTWIDS